MSETEGYYSAVTAYENAIRACLAWEEFKLGKRTMYECDELTQKALDYHRKAADARNRKVA